MCRMIPESLTPIYNNDTIAVTQVTQPDQLLAMVTLLVRLVLLVSGIIGLFWLLLGMLNDEEGSWLKGRKQKAERIKR